MRRDHASALEEWAGERCGIYGESAGLIWAGPYHDAAVLDRVALCWLTHMAHTAMWHLARLRDTCSRDEMTDRMTAGIVPAFDRVEP